MAQTLDSKGNLVIDGLSTNLNPQQFAASNAFKTPSVVADVPSSVPFNSLVNQPKLTGSMGGTVVPPVNTSAVNQALSYSDIVAKEQEKRAQTQADIDNNAALNEYKKSLGLYGDTSIAEAKALETANLNKSLGVTDKTGIVTSLRNQIRGLDVTGEAQKQGIVGKGYGAENIVTGNETIDRQNAIKRLNLTASLYAAEGDLETAKATRDEAITAKYAPQETRLNNIKSFLDMNKDVLSREDAKANAEQTARVNAKIKDIEEQKLKEKEIGDMILEATPNAPTSVIANAKKLAESGASKLAVVQALGKYAGDYWAREKIKAEINRIDSESAKNRAASITSSTSLTGSSSSAKDWVAQYNSGAMSLEDIYTKIGSTKEALAIKNEVASLINQQGGKRKYGTDDASIQAIQSQIKNVNDLLYGQGKTETDKTTGDYGTIAGFVQGGLGIIPDRANVYKQDALAIAKNLVSNQTLQALADAKSKGVTFGALSETELKTVADSASRISAKLKMEKDGTITGFTGSEKQFKDDLKIIKDNLEKSIAGKTQSTQPNQTKADTTADDIMTANKNIQKEQSGLNLFNN